MAGPSAVSAGLGVTSNHAVLTRTIIRSPVIRWILPARIRHQRLNDVVFVGDDFIEVKQVKREGHLEHVCVKNDFGCRIRAANTFSVTADPPDEDDLWSQHDTFDTWTTPAAPPQFLVLTLDCDDILFLYLRRLENGQFSFEHQTLPLPTWPSTLRQAGEHMAVDPQARAIAVTAREGEVALFHAKTRQVIKRELEEQRPNWCPVGQMRLLSIQGVIQHIDFLTPPNNDTDHVILLLIVIDERKTRAIWIDWRHSEGVHNLHQHPPLPVESPKCVSSLLIPLCNASFLLIHGHEATIHRDILSGSLTSTTIHPPSHDAQYPGNSPKQPVWANWCRPLRTRTARHRKDFIYLAREDGFVFLLEISTNNTVQSAFAGELRCHVGEAFASLGDAQDPDILAVAGDMSTGRIVSMGHFPTARRLGEMSRVDTMGMQDVNLITNWASVTDMVVSKLPQSHSRPARLRDGIFLLSGRQPFGRLTELRSGIEARVLTYFQMQGFRGTIDLWALPDPPTGSVVLLLSTPDSTRLLLVSANAEEVEEVGNQNVFETDQRTLAADVTPDGHLIQVTERTISVAASLMAGFEDRSRKTHGDDIVNIAAAIEPASGRIVCAEKSGATHAITSYLHPRNNDPDSDMAFERGLRTVGDPFHCDAVPLCLATAKVGRNVIVLVATTAQEILILLCNDDGLSKLTVLQTPSGAHSHCDHAVLLRPSDTRINTAGSASLLAVCGLRNGNLMTFTLDPEGDTMLSEPEILSFGHSTVKIVRHSSEPQRAYAMSGLDTCLLTFDIKASNCLKIESIWASDKGRPELRQGQVLACTKMPDRDFLSSPELADSLIMISGEELWFSLIDKSTKTVARQIPVNGTPFRLLYAESQRCWVCASTFADTRFFGSSRQHGKPEERRQKYPVIDFIPSNADSPSFTFRMQPGEQINALLEWSPKIDDERTYSYILLGGHFTENGSQRGKITLLQPSNDRWEIVDVHERRMWTFDSPVYALASYDDMTFVASCGRDVVVYRLNLNTRKWETLCAPYQLSSPGIVVSCAAPLIHVSTLEDCIVTLRVQPCEDNADKHKSRMVPISMGPRADKGLTHVVLRNSEHAPSATQADADTLLTTTRHGQLLGLSSPVSTPLHAQSARILFEVQLPRSITRLRQCDIRPPWKATQPTGVRSSGIIGCATDGSIIGVSIIDETLWRRLFWLQRLCEWSPVISPYSHDRAPYSIAVEGDHRGEERALPIGLSESAQDDIVLFASHGVEHRGRDKHIDGDVLARLLEHGGAEALRALLRDVAHRQDRIGIWLRQHLDAEFAAVDATVADLEVLLDAWL